MKFWLASKPMDGQTREEFDFEWSYIHVALMLTTPVVMRSFQRYTQHRVPAGVTDDLLPYGRHPNDWYCISDHWLDSFDDLIAIFTGEEYPRRMSHHKFGNDQFTIELTGGEVLFDQPVPFTGRGGVKLVNFLSRSASVDQPAFAARWKAEYAPFVLELARAGHLKRYVQSPQLPLDPALFAGSLFEAGKVQTYAGIEELWFENLDALGAFVKEQHASAEQTAACRDLIDASASFSMVVVERVVWDFTGDSPSPRPAIENPASIEGAVLKQEKPWGEWGTIDPVRPG